MTQFADFIVSHTTPSAPPACPEIGLHLAADAIALWEATEIFLERPNLPPPYWAFCWAGGQALTRYLLDNPALVAGKRVLDFAAGCGASAIAAAKLGAATVDAAEIDDLAIEAITLNAALNGVAVTTLRADVVGTLGRWDVVVAGDVCYERPMTDHIWPWLKRMAESGTLVLMADPGRAYLPKHGLTELARHTVATLLTLEDREFREVVVYRLTGAS